MILYSKQKEVNKFGWFIIHIHISVHNIAKINYSPGFKLHSLYIYTRLSIHKLINQYIQNITGLGNEQGCLTASTN